MKLACIGAPHGNIYASFKTQPAPGMLALKYVLIKC